VTPQGTSYAPARPSLRDLRRDRTRDEIAQAALELIEARGYGETHVDEIAARALISPRTFYRYFPAKEEAFLHGLPAFEAALGALEGGESEGSLLDDLSSAGDAFCTEIEEHRSAVLARLPHALDEPALLGQLAYRLYAAEVRLARKLRPRLAASVSRAWEAEVLAAAVTASLMAALRRWQKSPRRMRLKQLVKQAMAALGPAVANMDKH